MYKYENDGANNIWEVSILIVPSSMMVSSVLHKKGMSDK